MLNIEFLKRKYLNRLKQVSMVEIYGHVAGIWEWRIFELDWIPFNNLIVMSFEITSHNNFMFNFFLSAKSLKLCLNFTCANFDGLWQCEENWILISSREIVFDTDNVDYLKRWNGQTVPNENSKHIHTLCACIENLNSFQSIKIIKPPLK